MGVDFEILSWPILEALVVGFGLGKEWTERRGCGAHLENLDS